MGTSIPTNEALAALREFGAASTREMSGSPGPQTLVAEVGDTDHGNVIVDPTVLRHTLPLLTLIPPAFA